ncbi:hypothetical protein TRIUR3_12194 [Triticum urartu]|uniref:Uncharacterized protein n=1 Tax=Triticum urartu TaxID=4572 RepID=M8A229_TRIUA|nr:hypothetical protein TRIUR3_12194 [Triticum urartu]
MAWRMNQGASARKRVEAGPTGATTQTARRSHGDRTRCAGRAWGAAGSSASSFACVGGGAIRREMGIEES